MDSNHRSPRAIGQVRTPEWRSPRRKYLHSLCLGALFNAGMTRGTGSSNPSPSSKESANFRSLSGGRIGVRNIASRSAWSVPRRFERYPDRDRRQVLLDLIETRGETGKPRRRTPGSSTSGIIMLLAIMCITAAPMVRSRYHNLFEFVHRFFGWSALLLMWMMLILTTSWGPGSAAGGSPLSATECISFGLAASIAALILAPWLTVRKVTVHPRILSRSVIEIKFAGSSGPGMFGRISRHPLADWHAFALVPGGRGTPSHSMVISAIGDFTKGQSHRAWCPAWISAPDQYSLRHQ
jgi:hypothetical protein